MLLLRRYLFDLHHNSTRAIKILKGTMEYPRTDEHLLGTARRVKRKIKQHDIATNYRRSES